MMPSTSMVVPRRPNSTTVTIINDNNNKSSVSAISQRISVFEPYPMRDTIQHFCEKHLDKIKAYMENVSMHIPPPAKCIIEGKLRVVESNSKYPWSHSHTLGPVRSRTTR